MTKQHIAAFVFCALALPTAALAATPLPYSPEQTPLTWDQLKDACANPSSYGNQLAPTNIYIDCVDTKTGWRLSNITPGSSHYSLSVYVASTKGFVAPDVTSSAFSAPDCHEFVEETKTRRITQDNVMCIELEGFISAQDYCAQKLVNEPVVVELTGQSINTCSLPTGQRP